MSDVGSEDAANNALPPSEASGGAETAAHNPPITKPPLIPPRIRRWVWGWRPLLIIAALFGLIQLVPYRIHNGAVVAEPQWDSPRTRELAVRACFNCHSEQVEKPWYANVAPVSWWLTNHVKEGRNALNFSNWSANDSRKAREAIETIQDGSMPPSYYTWFGLHREAKLTPDEQAALIAGLRATFANSGATTAR